MNYKELSKWDKKFFDLAILTGSWSKDTKHKIGAIVVDNDHTVLAGGYNGFPRGVKDDERLLYKNRDIKNSIIVHAEANCIAAAARNGHSLKDGTMYVTMPPCSQCASLIVQAGIVKVYYFGSSTEHAHWGKSMEIAQAILEEACTEWIEVKMRGGFKLKRIRVANR